MSVQFDKPTRFAPKDLALNGPAGSDATSSNAVSCVSPSIAVPKSETDMPFVRELREVDAKVLKKVSQDTYIGKSNLSWLETRGFVKIHGGEIYYAERWEKFIAQFINRPTLRMPIIDALEDLLKFSESKSVTEIESNAMANIDMQKSMIEHITGNVLEYETYASNWEKIANERKKVVDDIDNAKSTVDRGIVEIELLRKSAAVAMNTAESQKSIVNKYRAEVEECRKKIQSSSEEIEIAKSVGNKVRQQEIFIEKYDSWITDFSDKIADEYTPEKEKASVDMLNGANIAENYHEFLAKYLEGDYLKKNSGCENKADLDVKFLESFGLATTLDSKSQFGSKVFGLIASFKKRGLQMPQRIYVGDFLQKNYCGFCVPFGMRLDAKDYNIPPASLLFNNEFIKFSNSGPNLEEFVRYMLKCGDETGDMSSKTYPVGEKLELGSAGNWVEDIFVHEMGHFYHFRNIAKVAATENTTMHKIIERIIENFRDHTVKCGKSLSITEAGENIAKEISSYALYNACEFVAETGIVVFTYGLSAIKPTNVDLYKKMYGDMKLLETLDEMHTNGCNVDRSMLAYGKRAGCCV
jgi:hypothetical protein